MKKFLLTSDVERHRVAGPVPLDVVRHAGVDPGLTPSDVLQHQALVGDDHALLAVVEKGVLLNKKMQFKLEHKNCLLKIDFAPITQMYSSYEHCIESIFLKHPLLL